MVGIDTAQWAFTERGRLPQPLAWLPVRLCEPLGLLPRRGYRRRLPIECDGR
jgi:hypothetical protein